MDPLVVLPVDEIDLLVTFPLIDAVVLLTFDSPRRLLPLPSLGNILSFGRPYLLDLTVPNKWMPHSSKAQIK